MTRSKRNNLTPLSPRDTSGKFLPGHSGNPLGAPRPASRVWAEFVKLQAQQEIELADGTTITGDKLVADLIVQGLTTGRITFPKLKGQRTKVNSFRLSQKDWMALVERTRAHIEPGPRAEVDVTSDGQRLPAINNVIVYLPDNGRDDRESHRDDVVTITPSKE